jgi:hypothetical protein
MTDLELLAKALEDLEWARSMLKADGDTWHECLDDSIAAITKRLESINDQT